MRIAGVVYMHTCIFICFMSQAPIEKCKPENKKWSIITVHAVAKNPSLRQKCTKTNTTIYSAQPLSVVVNNSCM